MTNKNCPKCNRPYIRKRSTSDGSIVSYVHADMRTSFGSVASEAFHVISDERYAAQETRRRKVKDVRKSEEGK